MLIVSNSDIIWFNFKTFEFFFWLTLNKFFMKSFLFENRCFTFFVVVVYYTRVTLQQCSRPKIMCDSSCSGNIQKSNLRQFSLQCWRLQDSNLNGTGLHQGSVLEMFKENNLAKVSFLKLLTKVLNVFISLQLTKNGHLL